MSCNEASKGQIEIQAGSDRKIWLNLVTVQVSIPYTESKKNDNHYIARIDKNILTGIEDEEGAGYVWVPHTVVRGLVMVPDDKLVTLEDITLRVRASELFLR